MSSLLLSGIFIGKYLISPSYTLTADWGESRTCRSAARRSPAACAPLVVRAVGADNLRRMLDLATVEPIARRHIQEAGVADRVKVRAGHLRSDRLVEGSAKVPRSLRQVSDDVAAQLPALTQ